jgi:uncharacterized membrane protein
VPRPPAAPVERIEPAERGLSALAYLIPLVTSVGLLIFDTRRAAVRFHAAQALALDATIAALLFGITQALNFAFVPTGLGFFILTRVWDLAVPTLFIVPRLFLLVQSARGAHVRLPWLADFADARARTATERAGPPTPP